MHGRLKVRTTAEELARKKKEQAEKVKMYRAAMSRIMSKRTQGEYDLELMELISKVLSSNPDIYTLWNIRKECIQKLIEENKENAVILEKDLGFVEVCLHANPKSYNAWYHRIWVLENSESPNWNREVDLCTKYLRLDERNFHVWFYRRFVVEKANVALENELQFSTEKIEKNFSNYSSWHYRSQLLPILHPHETDKSRPICEEKLKEELELVLTAAFTDPNDSSAWFYQRWLLGYSAPELDIAAFKITPQKAVISFTKAINLNSDEYSLTTNFCPVLEFTKFRPSKVDEVYEKTWILDGPFKFDDKTNKTFEVTFKDASDTEHGLVLKKCGDKNVYFAVKTPRFEYEFGSAIRDQINEQLESCHVLLGYEPDSKWTLLTTALLMRAIDRRGNSSKSLEYLKKLQQVDEMRRGYYMDLASKWTIQEKLENWIELADCTIPIDLSGLNLTGVFYEEYLSGAENVNLGNNQLSNRNLGKLKDLQFCKKLNLSGNKDVTSLETFPKLDSMQELRCNGLETDETAF